MNTWYSMARHAADHQHALLDEARRNRLARSAHRESGDAGATSAPRQSVLNRMLAMARSLRPV